MKTLKYLAIIVLCFYCISAQARSRKFKKNEFEIGGFYGISGLSGSLKDGKITPGLGYQFSLTDKYFFSPNFGVGLGVAYANYSTKSEMGSISVNTPAKDNEGENFEYRITASGIKEEQTLSALEIPLFMVYRKKVSKKFEWNGSLGLKVSLPLTATYETTDGTIETKGYYASYNSEFSNMPNHGFEKIDKISYSGDLTTKLAYSLFSGFGVSIPMGKVGINIGIYASYGFSSVLQPGNNQLVTYPLIYNSLTNLSEKTKLVSGGLKIGVIF